MQCAEMRPNKDKQYVDVLAHHRLDGQTIPIRFKAEDNFNLKSYKLKDMVDAALKR